MACKWINGEFSLGRSTEEGSDKFKGPYTHGVAIPISKIDDFVKHVYRDRCGNSETWKAEKGHWDGSFKDNGKSGCGVVRGSTLGDGQSVKLQST